MTKITVDKAMIEQAIEAAFSPYCTQDLAILVPALRAALAEPAVEPVAWYDGNKFYATESAAYMACADIKNLRPVRAPQPAVEPVAKHCMPHGWVINWPHPDGGTRPVYHPSSIQPKFGNDMKPDMYPVYTSPPPPDEVPLLTEQELRSMHHIEEFGLFCDADEFEQIARAIERAVRRKAGL